MVHVTKIDRLISLVEFNIYGSVSKWGALRAPLVAEAAKAREWQRSKFERANSEQIKFRAPQQGHNGPAAPKKKELTSQVEFDYIWKRIEVVITALTRNQVARKGSWVRIPPLPPKQKGPSGDGSFVLRVGFEGER